VGARECRRRPTPPGDVELRLGGRGASLIDVVVRGADQPLRVSADDLFAELSDPDGGSVVRLARIWEDKITRDHAELRAHIEHVLATATRPDHAEPHPHARRRRYYRRRVGPRRRLLVVVSFEQQPGRIITAVATHKDPKQWEAVNVTIASHTDAQRITLNRRCVTPSGASTTWVRSRSTRPPRRSNSRLHRPAAPE
jgi:hypothetical protein